MLALDDVRFAYPGAGQTYNFTMEARDGEVTAIRGASGAGKSTLLDLAAGFLEPLSGTIRVGGADVTALPPERRPVSIMFQSGGSFEHLSVARNIALGLKGARPDDPHILSVLAEIGLQAFASRKAQTLSGGQEKRMQLARMIVQNRPVLLLDEPFSALDDDARLSTRNLVKSLTQKHQWATVLVTHHAEDISAIADRTYRLVDGRLDLA